MRESWHFLQTRSRYWAASIALLGIACAGWFFAVRLSYTSSPVVNLTDETLLSLRNLPSSIRQNPRSPKLLAFKKELEGEIPAGSGLQRAIAIRKWCRLQQTGNWAHNDDTSEDPAALLQRQRSGTPGTCRRFAYVFAGALLAEGLDSRVVALSHGLRDLDSGHTLVEVWIEELNQWVLMDSMFNVMFRVDGKPASLIEVYNAVGDDPSRVQLDRNGTTTEPAPKFDATYIAMFQHIFVSTTNAVFDDYLLSLWGKRRIAFAHFARPGIEPYPEDAKQSVLALAFVSSLGGVSCLLFGARRLFSPRETVCAPPRLVGALAEFPGSGEMSQER